MMVTGNGTRVFHIMGDSRYTDGVLTSHCGQTLDSLRVGDHTFHGYVLVPLPGFRDREMVCEKCWEHAVIS